MICWLFSQLPQVVNHSPNVLQLGLFNFTLFHCTPRLRSGAHPHEVVDGLETIGKINKGGPKVSNTHMNDFFFQGKKPND